jgi:hypothetical protein
MEDREQLSPWKRIAAALSFATTRIEPGAAVGT